MVKLSIDAINSNSPYKVSLSKADGFFQFTTDYGIRYTVGFEQANELLKYETYQFLIINVNNQKSPRDEKLKKTILAVIKEFFRVSNTTMLYICETGDNKQSMRNRLFEYWFSSSAEIASAYTIMSSEIRDEDGVSNYAAIILRIDNPNYTEIIADFSNTVKFLNQKP